MATAEKAGVASIHTIKCKNCGASLRFEPGTASLKCEFCNTQNDIPTAKETVVVEEIDFEKFLSEHNVAADDKIDVATVTCSACGASSTLGPNLSSDNCPFCDNPLVVKDGTTSNIIKPKYLLPFAVDRKAAFDDFGKWINGLWFAPGDLKNYVNNADKFNGVYIPYWTYAADTSSNYTGARGTDYEEEETYTTTENGEEVTNTRTVTHTEWISVAGNVVQRFDDLLVPASKSLPPHYASLLEPWDIKDLAGYNDDFLAGFKTEIYQIDVKNGFEDARKIMSAAIRTSVARDIGGDHQQINNVNTNYEHVTFKHILLPIWISAYRYNNKVYRFMVNGRTGVVKGERPYSSIKIALFVLVIVVVIAAIAIMVKG